MHFFFHFFFGVGFESALDPERPFSVLSIPDEVTRHSLLHRGGKIDSVKSIAMKKYLKHASTKYFRMHKISFLKHAVKHCPCTLRKQHIGGWL